MKKNTYESQIISYQKSNSIFSLQGAMSILSGILSPPEAHLRMPVPTERFVELFCNLPLVALLPPLSLNILLVCACAVYGFLTRKLPENFNESWYIFVSVATTLFLWLVFLPTYFTAFYASHQVSNLKSIRGSLFLTFKEDTQRKHKNSKYSKDLSIGVYLKQYWISI